MRTAAVAAGLALVLAADVAVVRARSRPEPPVTYVASAGDVFADRSLGTAVRAAPFAPVPDTDPCRPDLIVPAEPRPLETVRRAYGGLSLVTAVVRRWPVEAEAETAFRVVSERLRRCFEYDAIAPNGAVLVFSYDDVRGNGLGDEAVRVESSGGFAGSGRTERWEYQHVVRAGAFLLDIRYEVVAIRRDTEDLDVSRCWARYFTDRVHGGTRRACGISG